MSFDKCSELNVLVTLCNDIAFFRRQPPCFWWLFVGRNSNALTPTKPHNRFAGPTLQVGIWIFLHGNIPLKVAVVRQKSNDMFGYSFSTSRECTIPVISYLNLVPIGPCSQATGPSAMPGWIAEELGWLLPEPWDLAGGQCHWRPGSAVFLVFDCHGCTVMYQDIYIFLYIYILNLKIWTVITVITYLSAWICLSLCPVWMTIQGRLDDVVNAKVLAPCGHWTQQT